MADNSNGSGFRGAVYLLAFVALAGAAMWWVLTPPPIDSDTSPRQVRLEQLSVQMEPNANQKLTLAPWLNADVFDVGAVFSTDGSLAMAHSVACDQVETRVTPLTLVLEDATTFGVTPEVELVTGGKVSAEATRAINYKVDLSEAVVAPGEVELLNAMYGDADCLAAVANREVLVLFAVYRGSEVFGMKRAAQGSFDFSFAWSNMKTKLGLGGDFSDSDTFERNDTAMYWALTKVRLDDPVFGGATVSDVARTAIAKELVNSESDYAQRAIPNTDISEPSAEDIEALFKTLMPEDAD